VRPVRVRHLPNAEDIPRPAYAIDDQTAISVVDGVIEVISEGHWELLHD